METIKISTYPLKIKSFNGQKQVFDPIRKKFVAFTPEEFVRQNILMHLINHYGYRPNLIAVEFPLRINGTVLRSDIVVFNNSGNPRLIIECKAPKIKITQKVMDQAASYNRQLNVEYLAVSNGPDTYCCSIDYKAKGLRFTNDFPSVDIVHL